MFCFFREPVSNKVLGLKRGWFWFSFIFCNTLNGWRGKSGRNGWARMSPWCDVCENFMTKQTETLKISPTQRWHRWSCWMLSEQWCSDVCSDKFKSFVGSRQTTTFKVLWKQKMEAQMWKLPPNETFPFYTIFIALTLALCSKYHWVLLDLATLNSKLACGWIVR